MYVGDLVIKVFGDRSMITVLLLVSILSPSVVICDQLQRQEEGKSVSHPLVVIIVPKTHRPPICHFVQAGCGVCGLLSWAGTFFGQQAAKNKKMLYLLNENELITVQVK